MKKVKDSSQYNAEFPEQFNWGEVDSIKLSEVADTIAILIRADLIRCDRNDVPGLRLALNVIARIAEIEGE